MSGYKILVVDDNESFQQYLVTSLQEEGFHASGAASGKQAIDCIMADKPHVMLVDLVMPEIGGLELCRTIKNDPFLKDIILFVLSGTPDVDMKLLCFATGANEYLVKPVETRELVARINRFMAMVEEIKTSVPAVSAAAETPAPQIPLLNPFKSDSEDSSFHTVDFVETGSTESAARIKPKYGIYRVETLIGSGAMGHVFKAYDEPLERYVAIKILSKKLSNSPAFVERFRREAKVLAAINHPGIAFIYSFGEEEGDHYFAIQWCSGGSVADLIRNKGKIELLPAVDIILQSAQALMAASKKGIVHRDIKPSNILFDENQQVKIVDFGLASAGAAKTSAKITQVQEFLGTPSFMAPEQAQSSSVDHRADIYALGITFYYLVYGTLPYNANSAIEMVIKHASQPFPAYDDLSGSVPRHAYDVMEKMTQKNPEARFSDYASLIADLEQLRSLLLRESKRRLPRAETIDPTPTVVDSNLFDLLVTTYDQSLSGVMTTRWGSLQKRFLVRQGEVLLFESSQPDESIWHFLVLKNVIKKEDVPPETESMEAALNRFLLNQTFAIETFTAAYRELMKIALMQVFFWPVFEGEFAKAKILHDTFASIRISEILLEASRSLLDYQKVKTGAPLYGYIGRTSHFEEILSTLNLKPEESFIVSRLDGQNITLNTLNALTGLPEEKIGRLVYVMEKIGAVKFVDPSQRPAARRAEPPAAPPAPPTAPAAAKPTASKPASPSSPAASKRSSGRTKLTDSFVAALGRRFVDAPPPTKVPPPPKRDPSAELQQVRMEVNKSEKKNEADVHLKVAEQFYEMAEDNYELFDYWKTIQLCKQAIKNNPTQAKYYVLIAKAYAHHPKFGKDAEQSFYKAIELDPWNPDYHMELATFYLNNGLSKRAINMCQRALKIAPEHEQAKKLYTELSSKQR